MREGQFRRSLLNRLTARSINSYVSYCRLVERTLNIDLDRSDLNASSIQIIGERLCMAGTPQNTIRNCLSGVRAYALLKDDEREELPASASTGPTTSRRSLPPTKLQLPLLARELASTMLDERNVRQMSVSGLLASYGEILEELRARRVVRTGNSPVGDYAECLFATAFGWTLEGNSSSGHDATDGDGRRYQIKGRRLSHAAASRQLSAIRRLPEQTFDHLAAVLFDSTFKVSRAIIVPHSIVVSRARRVEHTNSWSFLLDDRIWGEPGARDVTAEIAVAATKI